MTRTLALALCVLASGCVESGRARVSIPVHGAGTGVHTFDVGGWAITLDEARIAWGPAYFCTTAFADADLCETALAEVRTSATIDALDPAPQLVGELDGITGTIRSSMFDYGITWLLPSQSAMPLPGAVDDAHSARFAGSASHAGTTIRFVVEVDMRPIASGVSAAHGVPVMHELRSPSDALVVRFDPEAILAAADFSELEMRTGDPVVLDETSTVYQSIVISLASAALPTLEWGAP